MKTLTVQTIHVKADVEFPIYRKYKEEVYKVYELSHGDTYPFEFIKAKLWDDKSVTLHLTKCSEASVEELIGNTTEATREEFTRVLQDSLYTIDALIKEEYA